VSKLNTVSVVYSLFSCLKCTRCSHPILTFLTFHEIEFATNVPSVLFTRSDFTYWCHFITNIIVFTYAEFGMNCWKNKLNTCITHCSECCVGSLLQYRCEQFYIDVNNSI